MRIDYEAGSLEEAKGHGQRCWTASEHSTAGGEMCLDSGSILKEKPKGIVFCGFLKFTFTYLFLDVLGLRCGARASHSGGFSCCGARALGAQAAVVVARGL